MQILLTGILHCATNVVRNLAASLGIELIYIPPYSPNLNPIERLWKFVKGKLRSKYYDDFSVFKSTIDFIVEGTQTIYKEQINTLIGEKVQLFDDLIPVCTNTYIHEGQEQDIA